jgi:hypothetical protein
MLYCILVGEKSSRLQNCIDVATTLMLDQTQLALRDTGQNSLEPEAPDTCFGLNYLF